MKRSSSSGGPSRWGTVGPEAFSLLPQPCNQTVKMHHQCVRNLTAIHSFIHSLREHVLCDRHCLGADGGVGAETHNCVYAVKTILRFGRGCSRWGDQRRGDTRVVIFTLGPECQVRASQTQLWQTTQCKGPKPGLSLARWRDKCSQCGMGA